MVRIRIHSLGKTERLKSRKQIESLFADGKKIMVFPFRVLYRLDSGEAGLKAGFTVSARNFPKATDRNRIKRLTREAYRLQKDKLQELIRKNQQQVSLFFIYTGREVPDFPGIQKSMLLVLDKLIKQLHEGRSSNT